MSSFSYDLIVIGGGPGGYTAALEAAGKGMTTALIEERELGGTCLNRGCIPTKTILHSAELYREMSRTADDGFGVMAEQISYDPAAIQQRKDHVVETLRSGVAMLMKKNRIQVFQGHGRVLTNHSVQVAFPDGQEPEVLTTENIIAASGSVPSMPPIKGCDLEGVMNSDAILNCDQKIDRLVIIGGGVIGMEFASIYSSFGTHVTVIEFLDRVLASMDREVSQSLKVLMKKRGVDIHTKASVQEILRNEEGRLVCRFTEKEKDCETEADIVLVATGRRPYLEDLFDPSVMPEMRHGRIVTDKNGRTSIQNIYAIGDVTEGISLAHAASAEAVNAVAAMRGEDLPMDLRTIPQCVYTSPEIACVGMTSDEVEKLGIQTIVRKYPMSANAREVIAGADRGFIKVTLDAGDGKILGAVMMCERATDMISEFGMAVHRGLTLHEMRAVVRPHPSFSEGITGLSEIADER